jgi:hypothetical protein
MGWDSFILKNGSALSPIPPAERQDLLQAYYRRLCDPDPAVHLPGAQLGPLRGGMRGHPAESRGYYLS